MQTMHRFGVDSLRAGGFHGFIPFSALRTGGLLDVPDVPGVYVVVRASSGPILFLEDSRGGWFKGKDPTVPVGVLEARWIDDAEELYIGKADRLRRRVKELSEFGHGRPVGHRGGRFLWQIEGSADLLVGWLATPGRDPRQVEVQMLAAFREEFGGRQPFANIAG